MPTPLPKRWHDNALAVWLFWLLGSRPQSQIAGNSSGPIGGYHAFQLEAGVMTDVGTSGFQSSATGINNLEVVVGYSQIGTNTTHAVLWEAGMMTDLGTLGGGVSYATGISDQGQVVGQSSVSGGFPTHGFLWQRGVMSDLNGLLSNGNGWTVVSASAINRAGLIVGSGTSPDGHYHALLLTPDDASAESDQGRIDDSLSLAAVKLQVVVSNGVAATMEERTQQPSVKTFVGLPVNSEGNAVPAPVMTGSSAQDLIFEDWSEEPVGYSALILFM
jgi:probable HAF family extracellular repeat protein